MTFQDGTDLEPTKWQPFLISRFMSHQTGHRQPINPIKKCLLCLHKNTKNTCCWKMTCLVKDPKLWFVFLWNITTGYQQNTELFCAFKMVYHVIWVACIPSLNILHLILVTVHVQSYQEIGNDRLFHGISHQNVYPVINFNHSLPSA